MFFKNKITFSIVMPVFNGDPKWLKAAINSVISQKYRNWELCVVDDGSQSKDTLSILRSLNDIRIKLHFSPKNQGIALATNHAIGIANGLFIGFMDQDDTLEENALVEMKKAIKKVNPDIIYSDEDKIDLFNQRHHCHFKPDYSPDLLLAQNYICHFLVIRKTILKELNGLREGFDGAQDHDLLLRATELTQKIHHIPKVLYHWRQTINSTALLHGNKSNASESQKRALLDALKRRAIKASLLTTEIPGAIEIKRTTQGNPLVSILIPFRDQSELLKRCVDSILNKTHYSNYEILLLDNSSQEDSTFKVIKKLQDQDRRILYHSIDMDFNYSRINNQSVQFASGEHLLFLNNDTEVISSDWLSTLLSHSQRSDVGAVGAKLYYPDESIQHAGVIIGIAGMAGHSFKRMPKNTLGYYGRAQLTQNLSAVTGACLMIKKDLFKMTSGFNEKKLGSALNDIDLCLRLRELGYLNVFAPQAELYHIESATRGLPKTENEKLKSQNEINYFKKRHRKILKSGDPYYNINLTLTKENFSPRGTS